MINEVDVKGLRVGIKRYMHGKEEPVYLAREFYMFDLSTQLWVESDYGLSQRIKDFHRENLEDMEDIGEANVI